MEYAQLQKEYGGEFIATLKNKIIAHGKTFKDTLEQVKRLNQLQNEDLSFRFIQPKEGICVYYLRTLRH
jgi:hypothetical protein